jgi:hypothetical protein
VLRFGLVLADVRRDDLDELSRGLGLAVQPLCQALHHSRLALERHDGDAASRKLECHAARPGADVQHRTPLPGGDACVVIQVERAPAVQELVEHRAVVERRHFARPLESTSSASPAATATASELASIDALKRASGTQVKRSAAERVKSTVESSTRRSRKRRRPSILSISVRTAAM